MATMTMYIDDDHHFLRLSSLFAASRRSRYSVENGFDDKQVNL
jgi:hypothetical protein